MRKKSRTTEKPAQRRTPGNYRRVLLTIQSIRYQVCGGGRRVIRRQPNRD